MKITYYIPHSSFFSESPYGRVTHAIGIVNGFVENDWEVEVIAESGILNFTDRIDSRVKITPIKPYSYFEHIKLLGRCNKLVNGSEYFLYRKTVFGLFWIMIFRLLTILRKFDILSEVNGFIFDYNQTFKDRKVLIALSELLHKVILRFDDYIYVVNEDIKSILSKGFMGVKSDKILAIHNGGPKPNYIDFDQKNFNEIHFVFFGILADYNELDLFIDSIAPHSNMHLDIVGFGPEEDRLKQKSIDNQNITFYGKRTFQEFVDLVNSWTTPVVGIVPMNMGNKLGSLSPIKAFDYMSLGMPILYSDSCLGDVLISGVHGLCYETGKIKSLESAIGQISKKENYMIYVNNVKEEYIKHTWKSRMKELINVLK